MDAPQKLDIEIVASVEQFRSVRELLEEMARWDAAESELKLGLAPHVVLGFFHAADPEAFKQQQVAPHGCMLLATVNSIPAGCAGFRRLDEHACELHHVWVSSEFRGQGIARKLIERLAAGAVAVGYDTMRLETAPFMHEAHALYASVGFKSRGLYRDVPEILQPFTLCMERTLR